MCIILSVPNIPPPPYPRRPKLPPSEPARNAQKRVQQTLLIYSLSVGGFLSSEKKMSCRGVVTSLFYCFNNMVITPLNTLKIGLIWPPWPQWTSTWGYSKIKESILPCLHKQMWTSPVKNKLPHRSNENIGHLKMPFLLTNDKKVKKRVHFSELKNGSTWLQPSFELTGSRNHVYIGTLHYVCLMNAQKRVQQLNALLRVHNERAFARSSWTRFSAYPQRMCFSAYLMKTPCTKASQVDPEYPGCTRFSAFTWWTRFSAYLMNTLWPFLMNVFFSVREHIHCHMFRMFLICPSMYH